MGSVNELGIAAECLTGARQALLRVLDEDVDDTLSRAVLAMHTTLASEWDKLADLINWRREVER